jgi:hypothetical protein
MAMNGFKNADLEALYEKVIIFINAVQKISELPQGSTKSALILEQNELLMNSIMEVNPQFAYIVTSNLETIASIQNWAVILAEDIMMKENLGYSITLKSGNLDFNLLKKEADGIRGYFLESLALDMQYYQQSDIEALYGKLIAYINTMQGISERSDSNKDALIFEQVELLVEYINEFQQQFKAIETEDREHIGDIIDGGAILAGFSVKPQDNPYFDITREWRKW